MYTVTFYSFKGGVGRTMALVNVAFELAKQGRSVMMVDFDLEAPGLDAFLKPYGSRPSRGLVDFVTDYRSTGQPPDVSEYVYEVGSGSSPKAWYMPAGRRGEGYGARLHSIDWRNLYENEDGFLLFEDLKAQWREKFQPDYVFLDSRTGHTDVGGICTRQLPDAVALMFRLDDQNLEGLTRVVSEIRQEEHGPRQKDVKLHFVPSNVPRTDDENNVLNDQIKLFQKKLDFGSPEVRIQHYDDLEMLKHTIFTLTRANTRIAQEYCELAREIARYNTEDVEGARDYIRNILKSRRGYLADSFQERVAKISSKHRQDAKILELLADLSQRQGKVSDAIAYLSEALDTGASKSGFLVRRAELNHRIGDVDAAARDLRRLVDTPIDNFFEVSRTISIARQIDREIIGLLPSSTALASLDVREKRMIANDLLSEDADVAVALEILNDLLDEPDLGDEERRRTLSSMALPLITARKFDQAIDSLDQPTVIQDYFNLAMARWASAGSAPEDLFADVLRLHEDSTSPLDDSANYNFCIAIAKWALGDQEGARQDISVAKQAAREEIGNIFSPWTYRNGDASHFLVDIGQAEEMMDEGSMIPPFILDQSPEETNNA